MITCERFFAFALPTFSGIRGCRSLHPEANERQGLGRTSQMTAMLSGSDAVKNASNGPNRIDRSPLGKCSGSSFEGGGSLVIDIGRRDFASFGTAQK